MKCFFLSWGFIENLSTFQDRDKVRVLSNLARSHLWDYIGYAVVVIVKYHLPSSTKIDYMHIVS